MTSKQRKRRRWIRVVLGLTAAGLLMLVLLPLWFPWVLRPIAGRNGLRFGDYNRLGWTRFALTGVHGAWDGTRLEVQRVESVLPTTWLWRRFNGRTNGPPLLSLSGGHLMIGGPTTIGATANANPQGSMDGALNQIHQIGQTLHWLLPVADLTNFTIQVASKRMSIPHAHWRSGRLHLAVRSPASRGEIEFSCRMGGDFALELLAREGAYDASLRGGFSRTAEGWRWNGELCWLTNRADLTARFTTIGWWPAQAQVDCRRWQLPAEFLQVPGYENLVANLTATLVSNRFNLQATGFAQPSDASTQRGWPTVKISLGADGDPNGVKLHTLNLQSPWLNADLTNPVGITRTVELLAEPAHLRVSVDLDKLPGAALTGRAEGVVRIEPQGGRPPVAQFRFSGAQVGAGGLDAKTLLVRGAFAAPILKLDEIRADFGNGSVMVGGGSFDGELRSIVGGHWQLSGGLLQKLLPGLSYAEMVATGELHGPLTNIAHRGEAAFTTFRTAGLKPLDVRAKWSGQHQHLAAAEVEWRAGKSNLSLGAAADFDLSERKVSVTLNQLSLHRGEEELYALQQPCVTTFHAGNTNAPGRRWTLAMEALNWRSERHTISGTTVLAWPSGGEARLTMTNVTFADFSDFLEMDMANVTVAELAATAQWSNGPLQAVILATVSITNGTGQVFGLRGAMQTDEFLKIELSAFASGYGPTLSVTGTVPVKVIPERREKMLVWDKSRSIALAGDWNDDQSEAFSIPMETWGQLDVSRPKLHFRVSGTHDQPSAELTAGVAKLAWQSKTHHAPRPKLEDAKLALQIRPDAMELLTFAAKLDGQPILATGKWPLSSKAWRELWSTRKLPDWNPAQGSLELEATHVAALSADLPEVLSPEGSLRATFELKTGKRLEGTLSLTNAATRPMGLITPLRDLSALVRFEGHRAVLQDFRGQIGGQPIRADGFVTIPEAAGRGWNYQINVNGTNVPLARSPEWLLRGDFAVSLCARSNLPAVLSGAVTLHDGLYVQQASALVWNSPQRPELRPPYFSVTNEPFAHWKLDLAIRGNRFLRARTPVVSGIASADLQLKGTLLAPVLTGDARVNSGRLIFPFGSLKIDQGLASLSGADPKGPELQVNASGRNYRYDLRLEVKGPADGASLVFSSTPPLTSEQILLMLTAGQIPQSDYSFSNSARAGRLGTFLGKDLLSRYFGSDPAKERLIIQTGESISEAGRLTYSVEYRLTDRWSIIGEYDQFNAFNTDLKWKVFTR